MACQPEHCPVIDQRLLRAGAAVGTSLLILVVMYALLQRARPAVAPSPALPTVAVATATTADVPRIISALGTVTPRATVAVHTRVDGPLQSLRVHEGGLVLAGQVLALIDPAPSAVALAQAQAQLARDEAALAGARADLERYRGLVTSGSVPRQQLDQQEAIVQQLVAAVAADEASVAGARLQLSYTTIRSPVTGRVGLRQVDPGNNVHAADATPILTVTQMQPADVVFAVPQDALGPVLQRLRNGGVLPVSARDAGGEREIASGRVLAIDNSIDPSTGTAKLKAAFENNGDDLLANQFVNVRMQVDVIRAAIVVPASAVQRGALGSFVFVVEDGNVVALRKVTVGPNDPGEDRVVITSGLRAGEVVVVDGADRLRDGMRVRVDAAAGTAAPAASPAAAAPAIATHSTRRRAA
jgi:multidrug efflux system membrane fusion protein